MTEISSDQAPAPGQPSGSQPQGGHRLSHGAPDEQSGQPLHHYDGGSPGGLVRIYRAAPPGTEALSPGDWVSLSPGYARQHGRDRRDPRRNMPVYTAEVPRRDVYWDENDPDEHGYQGPVIRHPDVLEEDGRITPWQEYFDAHPHGLEGWLGAAVALPGPAHALAHDADMSEDDRAGALLDAALAQGALLGASWADDPYSAREAAEEQAAARLRELPAGHQVTAFTVHRDDEGGIAGIAIHHYQPGETDPAARRYRLIDLDGWRYRHPALQEPADAAARPAPPGGTVNPARRRQARPPSGSSRERPASP